MGSTHIYYRSIYYVATNLVFDSVWFSFLDLKKQKQTKVRYEMVRNNLGEFMQLAKTYYVLKHHVQRIHGAMSEEISTCNYTIFSVN